MSIPQLEKVFTISCIDLNHHHQYQSSSSHRAQLPDFQKKKKTSHHQADVTSFPVVDVFLALEPGRSTIRQFHLSNCSSLKPLDDSDRAMSGSVPAEPFLDDSNERQGVFFSLSEFFYFQTDPGGKYWEGVAFRSELLCFSCFSSGVIELTALRNGDCVFFFWSVLDSTSRYHLSHSRSHIGPLFPPPQ